MFCIFRGDVLIGRSKLEGGDPPMGVASGQFEPTHAFTLLRRAMKPVRDGTGKKQRDMRFLNNLRATTSDGIELVCFGIEVFEYGEADDPLAWEVFCNGIERPAYHELFPHHVQAYEDQFKKWRQP